ncbi:MAG: NAD(P)/FAD-dependent oxidoreductase [Bacteroidia bacterium]|nr:NAD(P)/FAD-dependent oxidoreductase [Bacteroidia bacterium]MDW8235687.1 NAD(P)/FAD-dependent oxidoreductase [Bacteroidia bacterium]
MKVGIWNETRRGDPRLLLLPEEIQRLRDLGCEVLIERGAGSGMHIPDSRLEEAGANIVENAQQLTEEAEILLCLGMPSLAEIESYPMDKVLIGLLQVWRHEQQVQALSQKSWTLFALEHVPRTLQAQNIDVFSAMAALSGYASVMLAAAHARRALAPFSIGGTKLDSAQVVVIGATAAGMYAAQTAQRLGARVVVYDTRPDSRRKIQRIGAIAFIPTGDSNPESEKWKKYLQEADIVITALFAPDQPAPKVFSAEWRQHLRPGSVVVDAAADFGGNCSEVSPGENTEIDGVKIVAPLRLAASVPFHASRLLSRSFARFLSFFQLSDGQLIPHANHPILQSTCVRWRGRLLLQFPS